MGGVRCRGRWIILDKQLAEEVVLVHADSWNEKIRINVGSFYENVNVFSRDFFRGENVGILRKMFRC